MKKSDITTIFDMGPTAEHLRMVRQMVRDAEDRAEANEQRMRELLRHHFGATTQVACLRFATRLGKSGAQLVYAHDGSVTLMVPTVCGLVVRLQAGPVKEGEP